MKPPKNNSLSVATYKQRSKPWHMQEPLLYKTQTLTLTYVTKEPKEKKGKKKKTGSGCKDWLSSTPQPYHQMSNLSSESPTVQRKELRARGCNHPECCSIMAHPKQWAVDQYEYVFRILIILSIRSNADSVSYFF